VQTQLRTLILLEAAGRGNFEHIHWELTQLVGKSRGPLIEPILHPTSGASLYQQSTKVLLEPSQSPAHC